MNTHIHTNPYDAKAIRSVDCAGMTLNEIFTAECDTSFPTICILNGEAFLRDGWDHVSSVDDDVHFVVVPQAFFATPLIQALTVKLWVGTTLSYFTAHLIATGIVAIGSALIMNALFKPPKPPASFADVKQSPTYSLGAQGNQARLGDAIPVVYGRHIIYPDFAAQPYWEYENDEQYLYQVFCIGLGKYEIEKVRIEDTQVENFPEITWYQKEPGEAITEFTPNVVTATEVAGQEMLGTNQDNWDWIGPFIVNKAGTEITKLSVDITAENGLYKLGADIEEVHISWEFEYRKVDDYGNPIGSWVNAPSSLTIAQTDAVRRTLSATVAPGRYEVRGRRTNYKDEDTKFIDRIKWAGLRGYMTDTNSYDDVTVVAMKMKATNSLSNEASRKVNMIVTRKLEIYDTATSTWTGTYATIRNPAYAALDILHNSTYGVGLADSNISIDDLTSLYIKWNARGDNFDGVFDNKTTVWDALTSVCRVGRAAPVQQANITRFIRDEETTIYAGVFTPQNIVKDSFSIQYKVPSSDTADGVTVKFIDERTWAQNEISLDADGNTPTNPAEMEIFGISQYSQAYLEAEYLAKSNKYRRRIVSFTTEMEGLILIYGDTIKVSTDMTDWGQSARVASYNPSGTTVVFDQDMNWDSDEATPVYKVAFRKADGSMTEESVVTRFADDTAQFLTAPTTTPQEGWIAVFGEVNEWVAECKVISVVPDQGKTEITAMVETLDEDGNSFVLYGGRHGDITPDSMVDYTSATSAQTAVYGFIADDTTPDMSNGDEPYTIGDRTA